MKAILRHTGMGGLLAAQSQVAFNDNATKLVLIGLIQMLLPPEEAGRWVSLVALLLVAPFVLFAPFSGWLSDRFPKRDVMAGSLWLQIAVMLVIGAGLLVRSLPVAVGGFFLLGLQAALMSPARRGMVKELAGDNVGEAVGWMEMLCVAAILAGSLAGGQLIDGVAEAAGNPWTAGLFSCALLAALCAGALWIFRSVPRHPAATKRPFSADTLFGHLDLLKILRRDASLWRAAWGDAAFYLAGGVLMLTLTEAGRDLNPDGPGAARITGIMLALLGAGIAVGSVTAARLSRHTINLGLVPIGALGMALTLGGLAFLPIGQPAFLALLPVLGACGGLFLVPLGALLVDRSREEERGRILAASSMLSSLTGVLAVGVHALMADVLKVSTSGQLLATGAGMLVAAYFATRLLRQHVLRIVGLVLARTRYSVTTRGVENLPATGGALVVCNHVSYVDTLALSLACPRPIRFLSYGEFFRMPVLGPILRIFGAIPVSSNRAKEAILRAAEHVETGEIVCIFPEGQLTRTGCLMELRGGFQLIARRAKCPVIVAHLDGLWGSIHSYEGGRYFTKLPRGLRRRLTVSFSTRLTANEATPPRIRETLLELGEAAFRARPVKSLARALIDALEAEPLRIALVDATATTKRVRAARLLAASWTLGRRWRRSIPEHRVGVLLPPGLGGTVTNLGLLFAGKVPVNLNPSANAASCIEQAGVKTIITAAAVEKRLPKFPWSEHVLLIESECARMPRYRVVLRQIAGCILPGAVLARLIDIPRPGRNDEAALLFTSGTSGTPKGVPVSHANILGNTAQVMDTNFLQPGDRMLSALPLFHSLGLIAGLFFPLLVRRTLVTAPSPLDADAVAEAARLEPPTLLLTTPAFLRSYTKRVPRDAFGQLRFVITGAEKLPTTTASEFRERFGCDVFEGFGLTEASPVASLNLPHPTCGPGAETIQAGCREETVGRFLPGVAARFHDPETGAHIPGAERGALALRGVNIIDGYLGGECPERFAGGWFQTGDIVRVDAQGFVHIEGRQSRFSKIGGEMVSHAAVEAALADSLGTDGADCVIGRPCEVKGEELVLLTTRRITRRELTEQLVKTVPNLWIPRSIRSVDALPMLPSGKVDLAECRRLATFTGEEA